MLCLTGGHAAAGEVLYVHLFPPNLRFFHKDPLFSKQLLPEAFFLVLRVSDLLYKFIFFKRRFKPLWYSDACKAVAIAKRL